MELFESNQPDPSQQQTTLPVEPEPRYQPHTASLPTDSNEHGHAWLRIIALILIAIVLVVLIVLFARWVYHRSHHNSSTTNPAKPGASSGVSSNDQKQQGANATPPTSPPSSSSAATPSPSASPSSNSKISNTGPGNVVGVFAVASLAAAGLHFVVSLRRFNKSGV